MKHFILSILILAGLSVNATGKTLIVGMKGMHCKSCSDSLTKAVSEMPEVASCSFDFKKNSGIIELKEGKTIDKVAFGKFIEDQGYTLKSLDEKK